MRLCAKSRIPDNADTKEGNTTSITLQLQRNETITFALVYPIFEKITAFVFQLL